MTTTLTAMAAPGGATRPRRRWRAALAVLVTGAVLLVACGGDDDDDAAPGTTTPDAAAEEKADPAGVLKYGVDLTGVGGVGFDPTKSGSPADFYLQSLIYDSLLRPAPDGGFEPGLARKVTVVDPQTIRIELQEGVTFHDGTAFDAEAVKFGIERNVQSANEKSFRVELQDVASVTVDGPLELTIALKSPSAGAFYPLLAYGETFIVSPTAAKSGADLNAAPVGAGPFRFEAFAPERSVKLVRNDDYFQADDIRLAGVEFVQATAGPPQVNALRSGAIDAAAASPEAAAALEGTDVEVDEQASDNSFLWLPICKSKPPFDDVRVRKALNLALDRDAINAALLGGKGEPQWGFWTSRHRFFNPDLDGIYDHDPDEAKRLLEAAGQEDLSFDIMVIPQPQLQRLAEIAQQQFKEAGITANLVPSQNIVQDYFIDVKGPLAVIPLNRSGLDKVTRNLVPGSVGNVCNHDDPVLNGLVDELRAVDQSSDEAVELWHELQELAVDQALGVYGVFATQVNAWNGTRVGNATLVPDVFGRLQLSIRDAFIKA